MTRLPLILSVVVLLGVGAWEAWDSGIDALSGALVAAGLVALGVWLALESRE